MKPLYPMATMLFALAACKGGDDKPEPSGRSGSTDAAAAATAHKAPSGTVGGKPFAPTHVLLLEGGDGGKLGFFRVPDKYRDRMTCEEPLGSESEFEITTYKPIADWVVGKPIESELGSWSATGVDWNARPAGTARVTLTAKDPAEFRLAGTIEIQGDGWKLSGPFEGEYCPTKAVDREKPEPLAGMAWTMEPVDPAKLPATPVQSIIAGSPQPIAHAHIREVKRHDGKRNHQIVLFAAPPPEPCAERARGGWLVNRDSKGKVLSREGAKYRVDSFAINLAAAPAAGAALAGNAHHQHGEKVDQIVDADLQVFEPDGHRSWSYAQYFSAAAAIDAVTEKEVRGRLYLALPEDGKSMLVGAFTALRCPPID